MSAAAKRARRPEMPDQWERLERAAEEASVAVAFWKRRALESEAEVLRMRRTLEGLAAEPEHPGNLVEEVRRLRAENAALQSRMLQARKRVSAILKRLITLGVES